MKKSFLILLCVLLAMSLMFVACKKDKGENNTEQDTTQHAHTYDDSAWSSDQTNHWHAATCEHKSEQKDLAAHADANGDGVCDVCAYVMCAHTFEKTWSSDETNHWHASTCAHDTKKDLAAHADTDNDGYCDTCKYDLCSGELEESWESNSLGHWHVCKDGHGRKSDMISHTDANGDGACDVCGYGAHDHTWSDVYRYDADGHWQVSNCTSHNAISGEKAKHADNNGDLKCDTCGYVMHEHTYKDEWSNDETGHWHDASCGHDVKTEAEAHRDNDKDGLCDVCAYVMCAHTYEENWRYNETEHYHKANCGCVGAPNADVAAHTYESGVCTVCGYKDHDHTYANVWSSDETGHWYAASCGCNLKKSEALHTGMEDGICDICGYGQHEHTWASVWSSDADNHWYASTCEGHDPIKKNTAAHTGMDDDGICDICSYGYHEHKWSSAWISDGTQHWHYTECDSHGALSSEKSDHVDVNNDGTCDICEKNTCNHTYEATWTSDSMYHWHAALCGHNVRTGLAAHDTNGADGACSVCGSKGLDSMISDETTGLVSGGTAHIENEYSNVDVTYSFGKDYVYIKETDGDGNVTEYWHYLTKNDTEGDRIFSIVSYDWGEYFQSTGANSSATLDDMKGYMFSTSFLGWGVIDDAYGVENLLYALYNFAHNNENSNGVVSESRDAANGEYVLSFQCITGDTEYGTFRQVKVYYSVNENNVIVSLKVESDVYYDPTAPDAESTEGKDYILYPSGAVKLLEGAESDGHISYVITQTVGERNAQPEHNLDEILMSDFALADENGDAIGESLTVESGSSLILKLTGIKPDTASYIFDEPEVVAYLDGDKAEWGWYGYFNAEEGTLNISFSSVGDWEIDVVSFNVKKSVSITVTMPETTSLTPVVVEDGWWGNETDEATISVGGELIFKAQANYGADSSFTPSCDGGSITESSTNPGAFVFTATEEGTYVITLTSTANPDVTATLTVTVGAAEPEKTPAEILSGKWECTAWVPNEHTITVVFEPDSDGATSGYLTITDSSFNRNTGYQELKAGYLYNYKNGWLTITYYDGDELAYELDLTNGVLSLIYEDSNGDVVYEAMTFAGGSGEGADAFIGMWAVYDGEDKIYSLTVYEDGTVNLYECQNDYGANYDYTIEEDILIAGDSMGPYFALEYNEDDGTLTLYWYGYDGQIDDNEDPMTFVDDM